MFVVSLHALGVVDHQLSDISEEEGDVVIMPGADLNVGTPPIFPHEIVIFLICFLSQQPFLLEVLLFQCQECQQFAPLQLEFVSSLYFLRRSNILEKK